MKKLLSLILVLAMVLALSVCAFASGEPSAETAEVTNEGFGSDVYAFPFEMIINETKAPTYDQFVKASGEPSGEATNG